ncbi:polyprenol monophosphomannose synthase [Nanchangia anserum]|uniref:Polyprenol monophosphomannose synthase n=1 Tax=Nanchangia anserum TaxID=2692125 RepID=A0A8I0GC29_9ACTO|nr:polyprenol monophosphomannose synthase [Nanchangia anserum]MBD3688803.1 polyprenol monophosphomannose synthase [Nanchangia anserum]QOX81083.1 polyprenol monophosphomannose synthase [Nanchangia anserum]
MPTHPALVIIPTYNEVESLPLTLARLFAAVPAIDVLIVDDNSPDGTGRVADDIAATDSRVNVLHRAAKSGLGPAYLDAFRWAGARGYERVVEMDADGSHRPEQLPKLLARCAGPDDPDLVIGSRWVRGGAVVGWARHREVLSRAGNAYIGLMLHLGVADATAGFRVYRTGALARLDLDRVDSRGYCFQIDLTRRIRRAGMSIAEVPITFDERQLGTSKMSGAIIVEALTQVSRWAIRDRVMRR